MLELLELERIPFLPNPSPEAIFPSSQLSEAVRRLIFVAQAMAIGLLTGDYGSGKTTGLHRVALELGAKGWRILYTAVSTGGAFGLLRSLHYGLGLKPPHYKVDLSQRFAEACEAADESLLVIVDEAQHLNEEGLQQLRLLINREFDTRPRFALILAGAAPDLGEMLAQPRMISLRKRILMSYHMEGLTEDEAKLYIEHHLNLAGTRRKLFDAVAIRELFGYSRGNPRTLNQLALTALIAAVAAGKTTVGLDQLRQAVREVEAKP